MAGRHVGEQTYRQREGACQHADNFDRNHQRNQNFRDARRQQDSKKAQAVASKTNEQGHKKYKYRKGPGDHQLAGQGVRAGEQADHIATENEKKQRRHEREKFPLFLTDEIINQSSQKEQKHFSNAL